jgi:hypothetical protein
MSRVGAADDIDFVDADVLLFADALEYALRSLSLSPDFKTGILGFERLPEAFRERNLDCGVERDDPLPAGGLDHGLADHRRRGHGGLEWRWKDSAGDERRRCHQANRPWTLTVGAGLRPPVRSGCGPETRDLRPQQSRRRPFASTFSFVNPKGGPRTRG